MISTKSRHRGVTAGALENLGLGRISPFVKLGLEAMNGTWREIENDVDRIASEVDAEVLSRASQLPPLGSFQSRSEQPSQLKAARLTELLKAFNGLIGKSGGPNSKSGFDGLRRVFATVNLLHEMFSDHRQYVDQSAGAKYSNLRM